MKRKPRKFWTIVSAASAEAAGLYRDPRFIIEEAPEAYRGGYWAVPREGYARWFKQRPRLRDLR